MVVQRNSQMLADDRELCRRQFPRVSCHADRAAKLVSRRMDAGTFAACAQHPGIERCVVRNQKVRPVQQPPQLGPKFAKGWVVTDIVPGQPMDVCKDELLSRWPDEPMVPFHNAVILDMHDTHRASAVGAVICRFEIDCRKICHPPRLVAPSQIAVTVGWQDSTGNLPQVLRIGVAPGSCSSLDGRRTVAVLDVRGACTRHAGQPRQSCIPWRCLT